MGDMARHTFLKSLTIHGSLASFEVHNVNPVWKPSISRIRYERKQRIRPTDLPQSTFQVVSYLGILQSMIYLCVFFSTYVVYALCISPLLIVMP
jgi:hypothetical protein